MLTAHKRFLLFGVLPEHRRVQLVDKPFAVRDSAGRIVEGRAFGYRDSYPTIEVGSRKFGGMTWIEVAAAVERGAVAEMSRLRRQP
jgi:hypothetical protein